MQQVNRYYRRSWIAEKKFRQIIRYFAMDLTAAKTSELTGAKKCERDLPVNTGSAAGRMRATGHRSPPESSRSTNRISAAEESAENAAAQASGKRSVFGIFKRNGRVYTEIVPNCQKHTLQAIIRGKCGPDVIIHSDRWQGYDGLVDLGFKKHFRVIHHANEFASRGT